MKHRIVAVIGIAAVCAGCSSDPYADALVGTWGGNEIQVRAARAGVVMTLGCGAVVRVMHPVLVDASGNFTLSDSLRGSIFGGAIDTLPDRPVVPAVISGTVTGNQLLLGVQANLSVPPERRTTFTMAGTMLFTGHRGAAETMPAGEICRA